MGILPGAEPFAAGGGRLRAEPGHASTYAPTGAPTGARTPTAAGS